MAEVFKKRRTAFTNQCLKYLRYVLNDHFVLVLVFLMGFLMVQYGTLLRNFPSNPLPILVILLLAIAALLSVGRIGTYIEAPDKLFLLPKEAEVKTWLHQATRRAFLIWTGLQTAVLLLLAPIFIKLGLSLISFGLLVLVLAVLKWFIMQAKSKSFYTKTGLNWAIVIAYEANRKQSVLKFFSLFTTVKGLSTSVKRRRYLDSLLKLVAKKHSKTWSNLYLRAFLRSSDYFALTLRLFVLSLLALLFVSNHLVAAGLALLFDYLLLFQLLALYHHFDYQYMTQLYPVSVADKAANLKALLRKLTYIMVLVQAILSANLQAAALLIGISLVMVEIYLSYKIKKMIDEKR